jgi:hypothetical protein
VSDDSKKTMIGISPFRMEPSEPESGEQSVTDSGPEREANTPAPREPEPEPAVLGMRQEESASRAAASVDEYIAAKRKDLALKTQRLNLDEIDWDVDLSKLPDGPAGPGPAAAAWEAGSQADAPAESAEPVASGALESPEAFDPDGDGVSASTGTMLFGADAVQRIREASQRLEQEDALPPPPVAADAIEPRPPTGRPEVAQTQGLTVTEPAPGEPPSAITDHGMPAAIEPAAVEPAEADAPTDTMALAPTSAAETDSSPGHEVAPGGTMVLAAQTGAAPEHERTEIPSAVRPTASAKRAAPSKPAPTAPAQDDAPLNDEPRTVPSAPVSPRTASTTPVVIATGLFIVILVAIGIWWLTK